MSASSGELDDLVDQLQQAPAIEVSVDSAADVAPRVERPIPVVSEPTLGVGVAATAENGAPLRLTDIIGPGGLFDDPALEVAQLAAGQERALLVPVEIIESRGAARRYALRVTLRLDRTD
jgi:hypothetical protein